MEPKTDFVKTCSKKESGRGRLVFSEEPCTKVENYRIKKPVFPLRTRPKNTNPCLKCKKGVKNGLFSCQKFQAFSACPIVTKPQRKKSGQNMTVLLNIIYSIVPPPNRKRHRHHK